jgi:hypothetical protein
VAHWWHESGNPEPARRVADGSSNPVTCCYVVVELRGFEPLTLCMPSRDPRQSAPHETSRSRALHQRRRVGAWWFAWLRRAELLRGCCAKRRGLRASRRTVGTTFTRMIVKLWRKLYETDGRMEPVAGSLTGLQLAQIEWRSILVVAQRTRGVPGSCDGQPRPSGIGWPFACTIPGWTTPSSLRGMGLCGQAPRSSHGRLGRPSPR